MGAVSPEYVYRVDYEKMITNPLEVIDGICDFMSLPADEKTRRAAATYIDATKNHH